MFLLYLPYDRIASPTSFFLFVFFLLLLMKTHTTTETTWNGRIWRFLTLHHNPFRNPHSFCSDSRSTSLGLTEVGTLDLRKLKGAYHLVRKSVNFSLKSNGDVIFPEIPFRNCGVPSEVLLFFRSEWNGANFLTICLTFQFPVSHQPKTIMGNRIANGKHHFVQ